MFNFDEQPPPEIDKFPKIILDLKPHSVSIDDIRVKIIMMPGIGCFGVSAFPENFTAPYKGYIAGDKELLDSLWYFDTGYQGFEIEYEKFLQSLKPNE